MLNSERPQEVESVLKIAHDDEIVVSDPAPTEVGNTGLDVKDDKILAIKVKELQALNKIQGTRVTDLKAQNKVLLAKIQALESPLSASNQENHPLVTEMKILAQRHSTNGP